jgi:simple sugar transport system permease protein
MTILQASLATAVLAGTPLLYAALGELLSERVGVLNIGLEGIMLIGAAGGFIAAYESGSLLVGLLGAALSGTLFTLVFFTLPVVFMGASQVLVGFALWFVGIGLSAEIGRNYSSSALSFRTESTAIPFLSDIPWVGKILFDQMWPVYFGVGLALAVGFLLKRTRHGLNMRAIGDEPASAHAMGVPVRAWQAFYSGACGALVGVGGGLLSIAIIQAWKEQMTAGRGWVALALVIFAGWRPIGIVLTSYFFGGLLILVNVGQAQGWGISSEVLAMAPYVITVAILILRTWRELKSGSSLAPVGLGETFVRGQR